MLTHTVGGQILAWGRNQGPAAVLFAKELNHDEVFANMYKSLQTHLAAVGVRVDHPGYTGLRAYLESAGILGADIWLNLDKAANQSKLKDALLGIPGLLDIRLSAPESAAFEEEYRQTYNGNMSRTLNSYLSEGSLQSVVSAHQDSLRSFAGIPGAGVGVGVGVGAGAPLHRLPSYSDLGATLVQHESFVLSARAHKGSLAGAGDSVLGSDMTYKKVDDGSFALSPSAMATKPEGNAAPPVQAKPSMEECPERFSRVPFAPDMPPVPPKPVRVPGPPKVHPHIVPVAEVSGCFCFRRSAQIGTSETLASPVAPVAPGTR
jgi:hypothetical protein